MPERELDQAKRHPDVVKNIIKKDGRKDAIPYSPSNPPPATEGGRIWYATCSTASGTGAKTATTTTGDFVLATGSMVRILFTTSNTVANPTISIDGSAAKAIRPISSASGMANKIAAGEVIDLAYDGSNFVMTKGNAATTSFYGITKLNSATNSTSTTEAATPSAVKDVADAKVDKAGDTITGPMILNDAAAYFKKKMRDTSHYTSVIEFENATPSGFTYNPHFGFHNTGGNSSYPGVINLIPYGTNASPWSRGDGLSLSHDDIKFNGSIVRTGTVAVADGGTGATNAAGARANIGAVNIAGDTMTGNLFVTKAGDAYVEVQDTDTQCRLMMDSYTSGTHGLWSSGYYDGANYHADGKWLIRRKPDNEVVVNGNCTGTADNVTGTVAVANGGTGSTDSASALAALGGAPLVSVANSANTANVFSVSNAFN